VLLLWEDSVTSNRARINQRPWWLRSARLVSAIGWVSSIVMLCSDVNAERAKDVGVGEDFNDFYWQLC
jgi:hypothetical protein